MYLLDCAAMSAADVGTFKSGEGAEAAGRRAVRSSTILSRVLPLGILLRWLNSCICMSESRCLPFAVWCSFQPDNAEALGEVHDVRKLALQQQRLGPGVRAVVGGGKKAAT